MPIARVAFLFLLSASALLAEEGDPRKIADSMSPEINQRIESLIEEGKIAGAVTLVSRDGRIHHKEAMGFRDVDAKEPMTEDTIFRIYSMSKPITTAAAMRLVEQGKIALDDPVSRHLPRLADPVVFQKEGDPIPAQKEPTIRDLMRHTSGYSYGFVGGEVAEQYRKVDILDRNSSLEAMVEKLSQIPLQEEPGTRWLYSISVDVLGAVIQAASGEKLESYLASNIFSPLGMKDTRFYVKEEDQDRFASQHGRKQSGELQISEAAEESRFLSPPGLPSGGGGLCSTISDYHRFCQMILSRGAFEGKQILKPETVDQMIQNQLPESISHIGIGDERIGVRFGLGFAVRKEESTWGFGGKTGEIGWGGAASTHFWILPEEGLSVITLRNFMPYEWTLEAELKKLVYDSLD